MTADRSVVARRIYFAAVHLLRRVRMVDIGLSSAQLSAVATLVRSGETSIGDLAAAEGVRAPTMTRLVQRLESDGYVLRREADHDARISLVRHTSKGWIALEGAAAARAAELEAVLEELSDDEVRVLEGAVEVLERALAQ